MLKGSASQYRLRIGPLQKSISVQAAKEYHRIKDAQGVKFREEGESREPIAEGI